MTNRRGRSHELRAGDWVEVRSKHEILATLDERSQLDGLPFMPQMLGYCGKRFRVFKRAHKTCDTVYPVRGRRMVGAVHLDTRCDGAAYGGCEAACLLFWKVAWLKPVAGPAAASSDSPPEASPSQVPDESIVLRGTRANWQEMESEATYVCQATRLPDATSSLPWWDFRQYVEDYTSGNVGAWQLIKGAIYATYYTLMNLGIGIGPAMRWIYDRLHPFWRGYPYPRRAGVIPKGQPTPSCNLGLREGELVRVKSHAEILATLDVEAKNRGLYSDAEAVPYSGGTYRVLKRVTKILDEKTGKLITMKTPALILEGVVCQARYSYCRMFCPRAIYSWWREIWLERA